MIFVHSYPLHAEGHMHAIGFAVNELVFTSLCKEKSDITMVLKYEASSNLLIGRV